MQSFLKKYGVLLLILFMVWKAFTHYKVIGPDNQVLRADGKGYYAYLPALFIYHDAQMNFIDYYEHKYNPPAAYAEFRNKDNGRYVDKYPAGVAILQCPFFLMAHFISKIAGLPADGYAPVYQQFFVAGGFFYLFWGMYFFMLYLLAWNIKPWQAILVISVVLLGTNCYHYAVYEQCMSHIYSLSLFCIFIYGIYRVIHTHSRQWIVVCLFVLGISLVVRPVNILILLFVPFIAGTGQKLKDSLIFVFKNPSYLFAGILAASIPVLVQCLFWHWQTGKFVVYSYGSEGFEWSNPKMWFILFSYRKGWFVWTPMAFAGIAGLFLFVRDKYRFLTIFLFMALVVYILSCWWTPDYGMSFGAREFIEYLFVPAIGIALMLKSIHSGIVRMFLVIICFGCIYINQVQARQYRDHIILWDGMNKTDYWRVFLKDSPGYFYWLEERRDFQKPDLINTRIDKSFTNDFEHPDGWTNDDIVTLHHSHSGSRSDCINGAHPKSAVFTYIFDQDDLKRDSLVQASVWFYGPQPDFTALTIEFEYNGKVLSKNNVRIRKFADRNYSWNQAILQSPIPTDLPAKSDCKIYVDNSYNSDTFYLDDFRVDLVKK